MNDEKSEVKDKIIKFIVGGIAGFICVAIGAYFWISLVTETADIIGKLIKGVLFIFFIFLGFVIIWFSPRPEDLSGS